MIWIIQQHKKPQNLLYYVFYVSNVSLKYQAKLLPNKAILFVFQIIPNEIHFQEEDIYTSTD